MPAAPKLQKITSGNGSDLRQLEIQYNELLKTVQGMQNGLVSDSFYGFYGVGTNSTASPLARGSTDTRVGTAAMVFSIAGVPVVKAADNAGTAFGSLGTIPASTWGIIAIDVIAAGTVTYRSGAANYTTGYATEALAIAALPAKLTVKATVGYITILASASTFVVGTDALAGGSSGNPATTTNYYPATGVMAATGTATNANGTLCCYVAPTGSPWTAGRNGVLIPSVLSRGSTDTRVALTAFTYNANGLNNVPKAAVATGTAFGALGTIPADKWGIIGMLIDGAGTQSFISGPSNYTTGYNSEQAAKDDLSNMFPTAGLCFFGYVTIKTKAATAFIVGTDGLAGGSSGNVASVTNYYPTAGYTLPDSMTSALLANRSGTVLTSAQY